MKKFLEVRLSCCSKKQRKEINADWLEFLSKTKPINVDQNIQILFDGKNLSAFTKAENISAFQTRSTVGFIKKSLLEKFRTTIKGKYQNSLLKRLDVDVDLFSPIKVLKVYKISGKSATTLLQSYKTLPLPTKTVKDDNNKVIVLVKTELDTNELVAKINHFAFSYCKKSLNLGKDLIQL